MSATAEQLAVIAAVILIGLPVSIAQVRRARRQESVRARLIRLAHERAELPDEEDPVVYAAPYGGWMPPDVEDHLIRFLASDKDVADGFARLQRKAIEQKGETR